MHISVRVRYARYLSYLLVDNVLFIVVGTSSRCRQVRIGFRFGQIGQIV